jgi:hypothetical protein
MVSIRPRHHSLKMLAPRLRSLVSSWKKLPFVLAPVVALMGPESPSGLAAVGGTAPA